MIDSNYPWTSWTFQLRFTFNLVYVQKKLALILVCSSRTKRSQQKAAAETRCRIAGATSSGSGAMPCRHPCHPHRPHHHPHHHHYRCNTSSRRNSKGSSSSSRSCRSCCPWPLQLGNAPVRHHPQNRGASTGSHMTWQCRRMDPCSSYSLLVQKCGLGCSLPGPQRCSPGDKPRLVWLGFPHPCLGLERSCQSHSPQHRG